MSGLNSEQQAAVAYTAGPLMIVAGAGTGKTTVITRKIAHLIETKLATPEQILALTFTDKAATEMSERVDTLLPVGYLDLHISTFHAFCQRLLEQYALDIGVSNRFKLLTTTETWLLMRQNFDRFKLEYYRPLANPTRHIHELIKHFTKCKDELISPAQYLEYAESKRLESGDMNIEEQDRISELAAAYHTYNQILLENNVLDFGDLIKYSIEVLEKRPAILKTLQQRFKYILVDEFQDVNWAQYKLVKLLSSEDNQLTVVGDDDQSIYAFRGASVSNILRFKDDFPNAKEIVLVENYRSVPDILDLSYQLINGNNPDRLEIKLGIDKKLRSSRKTDETKAVIYRHFASGEAEVSATLASIQELRTNDPDTKWSDCAVLVRANSHAEPLVAACERQGIPYEFLASAGLYRQNVILDCLNFFKLVDNYHESPAVYRLLRLPFLAFKENDLQKITYNAKKKSISYYEALKRCREFALSAEGTTIADRVIELIHAGMKLARQTKPTAVLLNFLEESGYWRYLKDQGNQGALRDINYLNQFLEQLESYETATPQATVQGFLEHCRYLLEIGDEGSLTGAENQTDTLKIMTIHAAKGLEFRYVFMLNLVEDRFPTRRRGEAIEIPPSLIKEQLPSGDAHYQEERRLFYVGMTRAKDQLYLSSAATYGGVREKKISRFLAELGFSATEKIEVPRALPGTISTRPEHVSTAPSEIPDIFSFSQLKTYQTCPYQYKLANVLKLPSTHGNPSFSFGTTMHSTLQHFYERVQELNKSEQPSLFALPQNSAPKTGIRIPDYEELTALYDQAWIDDWYHDKNQRETYYAEGKKILRTFYEAQQNQWTIPVSLEGWFKIRVGEFLLRGRIDRIDQLPDGTLEIIDYKTGTPKEKLVGEDKDQLLIYQVAVQQLPQYHHIGAPSRLTFYYLNDNSKLSFLGSDKEIAALQDKLLETILKIRSGDFAATPSQFTCRSCDFKEICEFRIL